MIDHDWEAHSTITFTYGTFDVLQCKNCKSLKSNSIEVGSGDLLIIKDNNTIRLISSPQSCAETMIKNIIL